MTQNRSLLILLALILVTFVAIVAHPLLPTKTLPIIPDSRLQTILALYGDSMEGGPSHAEWVDEGTWRCRVESEGETRYCGLNIILAQDGQKGLDLSGFHTIEMRLRTPGHDSRLQFFMRHYDERYSTPEDQNSAQFNKFNFLPNETDGDVQLHFDELTLADWWSDDRQLPRELRRPAFHNVIALGLGFSQALTPGDYEVAIDRLIFVGHWVSAELWYLGILLLWLIGLGGWVLRRLQLLAVKSRRQRRNLDLLAHRNAALRQESERYKQLSTRDPLTGAYNRLGFEQRLSDMIHKGDFKPLSLILLDVDHFKHLNDSYGHEMGDQVLRELVNLLDRQTRKQDVLCRWGGEEFLLLCPATPAHNAHRLAEQLRTQIDQQNMGFDPEVRLTASFGVCQVEDGEPYVDAFSRADRALYSAKHQGRNRVVMADEYQMP